MRRHENLAICVYRRHCIATYLSIFLLLIFITGTARAAYIATSNITYSSNTILSANVVNCIDLTIDTNVALTTNGYDIYCAGNFINYGTVITGSDGTGGSAGQGGTSVANSFGGSGGGGGASTAVAGENGGNTLILGGIGGTITSQNGNPGNSPAPPTISNANIITWSGNFIGYFSSAGGGGGLSGSGVIGGNGVYGLYIQASNIIAGSIISNGIAGGAGALLTSAGAGGGGGAFVLLSYGGGGLTAGTYNTLGGNGGAGATGYGNGGSGGNGNVVVYDYGTIPPLDIITLPSISQSTSGVLDAGQTVTFSTSFAGGVSPYTYNWIVSNTISGSLVANSLYASSLTSNSFTWTIQPSAAGNTVFANVIITDSLSSSSQGSHTTVNSIESGTIKVNAAPSVISITPSAVTLDSGQSVTYDSEITGGTGPFTANLIYVSGPGTVNGITAGNVVESLTGQSDGTIAFPSFNSISATGSYTFNVIATDSASTPVTFNSLSNTITFNPALAISLSPSSNTLDAKQQLPLTATVSGGTPSFALSYTTSNSICGSLSSTSNALSDDGANTIVFTANSALTGSCATTITASVNDSATSPITETASSSLTVNPVPTATSLTPSNTAINSGQYVTYNVIINGGTLPITANLVLVSNSIPIKINGANAIPGTTYNTIVLNAGSAEPNTITFNSLQLNTSITSGGNVTFTVNAVDSESTPVTFNSVADTIIINAVPQHSGGGPSKYTFTLSDNINSALTSAYGVYTIYASSGDTSYYQNQLPVTLSLPTPYLNVSWACNVSISTSMYTYRNDVYGLGLGIPCGKYYTTYTPNLEAIYSLSAPTKINTTTTSTTTIQSTTTIPLLPSGRSITSNVLVSSLAPVSINFQNMKTTFVLTTLSKTPVHMVANVANATSVPIQPVANYTLISAFNISVSTSANVTVNVIEQYPCGVYSSRIRPFEFTNGTWGMITPFEVNTTACTVLFTVPKDPIVGIFQKIVPTTITTTISVNTTTVPTIVAQGPMALESSTALIIATAAITAVIILRLLMLKYHLQKIRRRAKKKFKSH